MNLMRTLKSFKMQILLVGFLLFINLKDSKATVDLSQSSENEKIIQISQSKEWKALLHYFENSTSEVLRESDFFLSPNGAENPLLELQATLKFFSQNENTEKLPLVGPLKLKPVCAFPARKTFLEKNGFQFKKTSCPDFEAFKNSLQPESLSLVFSTNYSGNPASLFGHTLIRMNHSKEGSLRDYSVNFAAAVPPNEIGLRYIPYGLLGLYPGYFQIAPYYMKVLEYNESESRDLWEYQLNYSKEEVAFWLEHLWELRWLSQFRYTFLMKNCSYQMNRSLEVIRPQLGTLLPVGNFYTLPGETIRNLKQKHPDLIGEIHFRPSHKRIFNHEQSLLTNAEKNELSHLLSDPVHRVSEVKNTKVLEAALQHLEYQKYEIQSEANEGLNQSLRELRVKRASLPPGQSFRPVPRPIDPTNQPDLAHGTRMVSFHSIFGSKDVSELSIRARAGIHERMDRDKGTDPSFSITFFDAEIAKAIERNRLRVRRFEIFQMSSWDPIKDNEFPLSWGGAVGWVPFEEANTFLALHSFFKVKGQIGFTLGLLPNHFLNFTSLLGADGNFDQKLSKNQKFLTTLEERMILRWKPNFKSALFFNAQSTASYQRISSQFGFESSYFFKEETAAKIRMTRINQSPFLFVSGNQFEIGISQFF